ncbi:MAG: Maf family protein [Chitinophagaceae bacterium]
MIELKQPIVLASKSPRRKSICELADVPFEVYVIDTDETVNPRLPVEEIPIAIAVDKMNAVKQQFALYDRTILAADTIVELDGHVIGKPKDSEAAIATLQFLSGRTHRVITGIALYTPEKTAFFSETTYVTFNILSNEQIAYYVDKYKPYDKAGAYAIQEWIGAVAIKEIKGDFYNVMGLPIQKVLPLLG